MKARRLLKRMFQGFCLLLLGGAATVSFICLDLPTARAGDDYNKYSWRTSSYSTGSSTTTPTVIVPPPTHNLTMADCRVCHTSGNNVERHHNLIETRGFECLDCHTLVVDPVSNTTEIGPFRNCTDCHSTSVHYDKHGLYIANWQTMSGVAPGTAPLWTQIMNFSLVNPAMRQYQVCYKCHSYNAFGSAPTGVSPVVTRSGINLTDQAMEFNPNNRSAHPIQVPLNSQTGSYSLRPLRANQMTLAWSNVGNQTMVCSDCHAAPPAGGMGTRFLLKGPRTYWPYNRNGKLWTLGDVRSNTNNWQNDLFCVNCHPIYSGGNWRNNVHEDDHHYEDSITIGGIRYNGAPCVSCHVEIPHGYRISRLIGYATDPAPYATLQSNGTKVQVLRGFRKASSPFNYDEENCYSTVGACDEHDERKMTYDQ